ncbi:hypothetical protein QBC36DRAFT_228915 [Triangularia setosa]|uniref:F-box domain-containing protein n=1 Tax=Triangularia setosa TaxID=2587417 RepID=A0AAN6WGI2_9PEZI|nr:hypothetical protein QBC36DRAFT_228915 [Podospora setosa]
MGQDMLTLSGLPNELLSLIIEGLEDETNKRSGGPDIKTCRLVCRRFCDLSSRLLVRSVQVGHSFASLARLDTISRHPSISRGVRAVEVVLSSYSGFKPCLEGKRNFINFQLATLTKSVQLFEVGKIRNISEKDAVILRKAHEVLSCWRYLIQEPRMQSPAQGDLALHRALVDKAFQDFHRLAQEQKSIVSRGALGETVASALLRIPWVRRLEFYDTRPYGFQRRGLSWETGDTVFDGIYQNILLPLTRRDLDARTFLPSAETVDHVRLSEAIPQVLAAVGGTDRGELRSLDVDVDLIALNEVIRAIPDFQQKVITATKKLTDLSIRQNKNWADRNHRESFLGLCCTSPDLRKYTVALETGTCAMSPLLAGPGTNEQRKNLTVIQVKGADIRVPQLKHFLDSIPSVLDRVELVDVKLREGGWQEVLDLLRGKTYRESTDWPYPVRISEAICPDPEHPLRQTFDKIFQSDATWEVSDADAYVMRYSQVNPFAPEAGNFSLGSTVNW